MGFFNIGFGSYTIISLISTLSLTAGSNVDCNGKAFHCVNSTHFKICVDLGGGISTTVDEFLIPCPQNTVCKQYNLFECEYELTTTLPTQIQSEETNEQFVNSDNSAREQLDIKSLLPAKQDQDMELSEKYYNELNTTYTNLTDEIRNPVTSSNTDNLLTSSNIETMPLNINNELTLSTTESGIGVTLPSNINTLVSDIHVKSNYNTEAPEYFTSIPERTKDSLKSEKLDLNATLSVIKNPNLVSSISILTYSDTVTLVPGIFSDPSLQENTPRPSNLNPLLKSKNNSLERNVDSLMKYNTTQLNNSDNNIQHQNMSSMYSSNVSSNINPLNSTLIGFRDKMNTGETNINKKINENRVTTSEPSNTTQILVEATTASTKNVIGTTNEMSSLFSSITVNANETLNITKSVEESSANNAYISKPIILEYSTMKTNEISSPFASAHLNYSVTSVVLTNPILGENNSKVSDKPPASETKESNIKNVSEVSNLKNTIEDNFTAHLNSVNISQYLTSTEPSLSNKKIDTPTISTSISEIGSPINVFEVLYSNSTEGILINNLSQIDNKNTVENDSSNLNVTNEAPASDFNILEEQESNNSKNHSNSSFSPLLNISTLTTDATLSDTYDKIVVEDNSTPSVDILPVLTTIDIANVTQSPALNVFDQSMAKRNPIQYTTTTSSLPYMPPLTTVSESVASNKYISKNSNPDGVDIFPILIKDDVASETLAAITIWDESVTGRSQNNYTTPSSLFLVNDSPLAAAVPVSYNNIEDSYNSATLEIKPQTGLNFSVDMSTKYTKNVSDLNTSLLENTSVFPKNNIPSTHNNIWSVIINKNLTTLDTLPPLTTEMTFSLNNSKLLIGNTTDVYKSNSKETHVLKVNKNETWPEPETVIIVTDLADSNSATTTETYSNVAAAMNNKLTGLNPIIDLISKSKTGSVPVIKIVATDIDNNNTMYTDNNVTAEVYNSVANWKSTSDLIPTRRKIQPAVSKFLTTTDGYGTTYGSLHKDNIVGTTNLIINDHQIISESTTSTSFTKLPDYILKTKHFDTINSVGLLSSSDSVINDSERNTTSMITNLQTTLDKPTTLTNITPAKPVQVNWTIHNDDTTVENPVFELNEELSYNSTLINNVTDLNKTRTEIDTASITVDSLIATDVYESANSINVINNTFGVIDVLSEYKIVSHTNNSIDNTSKLESTVMINPTTYISNITNSRHVINTEPLTSTTLSLEFERQEINKKETNFENITSNGQTVDKYMILKPATNNFSQTVDFNVTTDNNNKPFIDIKVKPNQITNNVSETFKVNIANMNNTDLNYTENNVASLITNNSKSIPFRISNPYISDIYNVSHNYENNITVSSSFDKSIVPKKHDETKNKESTQINKNEVAPAVFISNIQKEENKTEYLLTDPYNYATTAEKKMNETVLKKISHYFSEPSLTEKNNIRRGNIDNITSGISTAKNIELQDFYKTKDSGVAKSKNVMINKSNNKVDTSRTGLDDNSQLSEIPIGKPSGNDIKPSFTAQKIEAVNNHTSLDTENRTLVPIIEPVFKEYVSGRINMSKNSNVNRSELISSVKNIKSSNNFSEHIKNNWGVVNTTLVTNASKLVKPLTYDRNFAEVKTLTLIRVKNNYINKINTTSESSTTAINLLKNSSYERNSIKMNTHPDMTATALELNKSLRSAVSLHILNTGTTPLNSNITELELIREKDKITISEYTKRSDEIRKAQPRNSHVFSEYPPTIGNGVTKNIGNSTQNGFTTPIKNINDSYTKYRNIRNKEFRCSKRGKYSDANDCNKFYICIGRVTPIIGVCPTNTVFSEFLKQCTRNVSHCIRNNQFKCTSVGRFINILCNKTYFICAKKKNGFTRFTLQCQKGYYLDKNNVKCTPEVINISGSDENSSKNTKELYIDKSKETGGVSVQSQNDFECEKEGKFKHQQDCRKYYVCKKGRKSVFRRKIKKCDSGEVFHRKKKKCVDEDSYECDI